MSFRAIFFVFEEAFEIFSANIYYYIYYDIYIIDSAKYSVCLCFNTIKHNLYLNWVVPEFSAITVANPILLGSKRLETLSTI